jgi:hypothetical protein
MKYIINYIYMEREFLTVEKLQKALDSIKLPLKKDEKIEFWKKYFQIKYKIKIL